MPYLKKILKISCYFFAFFIFTSALWIGRKFGNPSIEQLVFHLQFALTGNLDDFDASTVFSFIRHCVLGPVLYTFIIIKIESYFSYHIFFKIKPNLIFLFASLFLFCEKTSAFSTINSFYSTKSDFFSKNYVHPRSVVIKKVHPKNLVLIYVESLEESYSNKNVFNKDLLASLNVKKWNGLKFNQFSQEPGTGWTVAGMLSTQCGVPLKPLFSDKNTFGEKMDKFLPGATCLGDILKKKGYTNVFMQSSSTSFSGIDKLYGNHGYSKVLGKKQWEELGIDKSQMNDWGIYDDMFFEFAQKELDRLYQQKKPFNLTLATIDTHGINGFLSKTCIQSGGKTFEDVVQCSANQVSSFVSYMKAKGYLKDTQVVILGDHLAMQNSVSEKLETLPNRHIFNLFISNSKQPFVKNRDMLIHVDMFPTILDFMGFKVTGGKLALGYSAFDQNQKDLPTQFHYNDLFENVLNPSKKYTTLWKN